MEWKCDLCGESISSSNVHATFKEDKEDPEREYPILSIRIFCNGCDEVIIGHEMSVGDMLILSSRYAGFDVY